MGFERSSTTTASIVVLLLSFVFVNVKAATANASLTTAEADLLEFAMNFEYLEGEFFLFAALGRGFDSEAPELVQGGPAPVGARSANLGAIVKDITLQFGFQEVGQLRLIRTTVPGFPRPLLNLSKEVFGTAMDSAFGRSLLPPFDPYANEINFLLAAYIFPYVGLTGLVGANTLLQSATAKAIVAGLLGGESGQDAVIRALLYERKDLKVVPYGISVAEFTNRISELRNRLGKGGLKDEGLVVPKELGAEGRIEGNVLAGDNSSLSYGRSVEELLRILYETGNERVPGGFFPRGANGRIARSFLQSA